MRYKLGHYSQIKGLAYPGNSILLLRWFCGRLLFARRLIGRLLGEFLRGVDVCRFFLRRFWCDRRLKTADTNRQPTCNPPAPSRIHARPREWSAWYLP